VNPVPEVQIRKMVRNGIQAKVFTKEETGGTEQDDQGRDEKEAEQEKFDKNLKKVLQNGMVKKMFKRGHKIKDAEQDVGSRRTFSTTMCIFSV
jgi:hypothetical protein